MYALLGQWVTRGWPLLILGWIALAVGLQYAAPAWDSVTLDGDFAYLPGTMGSVEAEKFFDRAYPDQRPRSQIVLIVARPTEPLTGADEEVADQLSLPFLNALAGAQIERARREADKAADYRQQGLAEKELEALLSHERALEKALRAIEESLVIKERNAAALHNRSLVFRMQGKTDEADAAREAALEIDPDLKEAGDRVMPAFAASLPLVDVWTRRTQVAGKRLVSKDKRATLIVLQMSTEFMAAQNIEVMAWIRGDGNRGILHELMAWIRGDAKRRGILQEFRDTLADRDATDLELGVTGSAAVGADMLDSANESLQSTEILTTVLVIAILLLVYRAPLLVAVPMLTIVASYLVATSTVAALTQAGHLHPWVDSWWTFKVFKTTRIFIVVILYGCGTDFCLFLIARYKEELLAGKDRVTAMIDSLANIGDALVASACTTIFGLSMMFFAEYGKFSNSGPAIAVCLTVTLISCLTLAPALLFAMGTWVFWPFGLGTLDAADRHAGAPANNGAPGKALTEPAEDAALSNLWQWTADVILARPLLVMVLTLLVMLPVAWFGMGRDVSYDFLHELSPQRASVQGIELLKAHFPIGESGPVSILAHLRAGKFDDSPGMAPIEKLTKALSDIHGVQTVRSLAEPVGDPPGPASFQKRTLRAHKLTREIYLARTPELRSQVTRFDVLLGREKDDPPNRQYDPFSSEARETLALITHLLDEQSADPASPWHGAKFYVAGTTASIRDLATVTERDTRNIQIYVVAAVFLVLIVILRNFFVSLYMMGSVLVSYYFTMGVTIIVFPLIYGPTYTGMDWKVPLFLFVILVAIGQDYNIYLVTRVFEEQPLLGPREGLRAAIRTTGAIITSCGIIMAGSFVSMTTGSLRAISELGFTLTFGILLDTFVVRTLLLPSFMALGLGDDPPAKNATTRPTEPEQQEPLPALLAELQPAESEAAHRGG